MLPALDGRIECVQSADPPLLTGCYRVGDLHIHSLCRPHPGGDDYTLQQVRYPSSQTMKNHALTHSATQVQEICLNSRGIRAVLDFGLGHASCSLICGLLRWGWGCSFCVCACVCEGLVDLNSLQQGLICDRDYEDPILCFTVPLPSPQPMLLPNASD